MRYGGDGIGVREADGIQLDVSGTAIEARTPDDPRSRRAPRGGVPIAGR